MAHLLFSVGVSSGDELEGLLARMNDAGMATVDISAIEAAQVRACPSQY